MKTSLIKFLLVLLCICLTVNAGQAQVNEEVSKVYVVFKTHLDVGFTDLSSVVEKRYIDEFIPKALDVAEKLCNKIAIIKTGELVVSGETSELTHGKSLEEVFMEVVKGD